MLALEHEVLPVEVDETFPTGETAEPHVERLAREKALAGAAQRPRAMVIGGDTVVVLGGRVLGKPRDTDDAVDTLLRLSGRAHTVYSAVALVQDGTVISRVERAEVTFRDFGPSTAEAYVATGEPMDKAGSYGVQGLGAALVRRISGDYFTVMGLPVSGLLALFDTAGWRYRFAQGLVRAEGSGNGESTDGGGS
jgi:septum formation protein